MGGQRGGVAVRVLRRHDRRRCAGYGQSGIQGVLGGVVHRARSVLHRLCHNLACAVPPQRGGDSGGDSGPVKTSAAAPPASAGACQ